MVGSPDPKDYKGTVGPVLVGELVRPSPHEAAGALRRQTAWYHGAHPTFADALALVRKKLWAKERAFYGLPSATDTIEIPRAFVERLTDAVCYAA